MAGRLISRRGVLVWLGAAAGTAVLAACQQQQPPAVEKAAEKPATPAAAIEKPATPLAATAPKAAAGPVKFAFWMWPNNGVFVKQMQPELKKVMPDVDLDIIESPGGEMHTKLQAALVAGSGAPDLSMIEVSNLARFTVLKAGLVDLNPYIKSNWPEMPSQYFEHPWKISQSPEGRQVALPKNTGPGVLHYRVELLEKAGLSSEPDKVHQLFPTWSSMIEQGQKIFKKGEVWLLPSASDILNRRYLQLGWAPVKDNQPNLLAPEIEDAVALAKKFYDGGYTSQQTGDGLSAALSGSKIAFIQAASWYMSPLKYNADKDGVGKWRITDAADGPFPHGGDFYAVTEQAKEREQAIKTIQWFSTSETTFANTYLDQLSPSAYKPHFDNAAIANAPMPYYGGQVVGDIIKRSLQGLKPQQVHADDGKVTSALSKAFDQVIQGKAEIKAALQDAQKQAQKDMGL